MVQLSHYEPFTTFILPGLAIVGALLFFLAQGRSVRSKTATLVMGFGGLVILVGSMFGVTAMNQSEHTANMDDITEHYQISDVKTIKDGKALEKIRAEDYADYLVSFDPAGEDEYAEGVISVSKGSKASLLVADGTVFSDYNQVAQDSQPAE